MNSFDNFIDLLYTTFPNTLELVNTCKREIYITSISKLQSEIRNVEKIQNYYCFYNYDSLDILFFPWKEYETKAFYLPRFIKKLEVKVSKREEIVFANIYINSYYIGNLYFSTENISNNICVFKSMSCKYVKNLIILDFCDQFTEFLLYLIIFSYGYIDEQATTQTIYNVIDILRLKSKNR